VPELSFGGSISLTAFIAANGLIGRDDGNELLRPGTVFRGCVCETVDDDASGEDVIGVEHIVAKTKRSAMVNTLTSHSLILFGGERGRSVGSRAPNLYYDLKKIHWGLGIRSDRTQISPNIHKYHIIIAHPLASFVPK
jgi:hypothetical protein